MKNLIPSWIRVPVLFFIIFGIVEYSVDTGTDKPAFMVYPMVSLFLLLVLFILIATVGILGAMEKIMLQKLDPEKRAAFLEAKTKKLKFTWFKRIYEKLIAQKPIEEEHEIILDHDYDGIKELDNSLPPWWLYGFYASILFAAIYLFRYHILDAPNQYEAFKTEMAEAKKAVAEYKKNAKNLVDINTVTRLTDQSDISAGKKIFQANCTPCHMADGGGGIGPNLTDKYWIFGGDIKHIFKTISEGGRSGKGMISWKGQLKPLEIAQVASYVLTLQGTTPANPKAPQGDLWVEPGGEKAPDNAAEEPTTTN